MGLSCQNNTEKNWFIQLTQSGQQQHYIDQVHVALSSPLHYIFNKRLLMISWHNQSLLITFQNWHGMENWDLEWYHLHVEFIFHISIEDLLDLFCQNLKNWVNINTKTKVRAWFRNERVNQIRSNVIYFQSESNRGYIFSHFVFLLNQNTYRDILWNNFLRPFFHITFFNFLIFKKPFKHLWALGCPMILKDSNIRYS